MARNLVNHEMKLSLSFDGGTTFVEVLQLTSADLKINGTVQEWTAYENNGWASRLATGKSLDITLSGNYLHGDETHKKLIALMFEDADKNNDMAFKVVFPATSDKVNPAELTGKGVLVFNGSELLGASTDVSPINFDIKCNGKPKYVDEKTIELLDLKTIITTTNLNTFSSDPTDNDILLKTKELNNSLVLDEVEILTGKTTTKATIKPKSTSTIYDINSTVELTYTITESRTTKK